jgi:hypothetical protein
VPNSEIVRLVLGVSSVTGVVSLFGYLYFLLHVRSTASSVRNVLEGEGVFNAEQVAKILEQFQDDAKRLEALKAVTKYSTVRARELLAKVENNVDLTAFEHLSFHRRKRALATSAIVFSCLAVLAGAVEVFRAAYPQAQHSNFPALGSTGNEQQQNPSVPSETRSVPQNTPVSSTGTVIGSPGIASAPKCQEVPQKSLKKTVKTHVERPVDNIDKRATVTEILQELATAELKRSCTSISGGTGRLGESEFDTRGLLEDGRLIRLFTDATSVCRWHEPVEPSCPPRVDGHN